LAPSANARAFHQAVLVPQASRARSDTAADCRETANFTIEQPRFARCSSWALIASELAVVTPSNPEAAVLRFRCGNGGAIRVGPEESGSNLKRHAYRPWRRSVHLATRWRGSSQTKMSPWASDARLSSGTRRGTACC